MTDYDSAEWFAVRVHAARIALRLAERLGKPLPTDLVALVEEGERREGAAAEASAGQTG